MQPPMHCPKGHQWDASDAGDDPAGVTPVTCPLCGEPAVNAMTHLPAMVVSLPFTQAVTGDSWQTIGPDRTPMETTTKNDAAKEVINGGIRERTIPSHETVGPDTATALPKAAPYATVVGYEILDVLGRGSMGVVYKARQLRLNRLVALKMVLAGGHSGQEDLARFRTEAEAIASLQHPNIVQIYETGESNGTPFFSMEFVEGGGLDRKIQGAPLAAGTAALLVEKLARAMHVAHQHGIIHRDLKSANILMTLDGEPRISDFGLAKRLVKDPLVSGAGYATETGTTMGTPSYMAPEQAAGRNKEVGPLADVYALGAILYDLLTGRPPFRADTAMDTLMLVVTEEPVSPSQLQPKLPRDLVTISLKCLEKDAAKRYESALALAEDLARFQAGEPIQAVPIGPWGRAIKWAHRRPAAAALVIVIFLASLGGLAGGILYEMRLSRALDDAQSQHRRAVNRLVRLNVTGGMATVDSGELPWSLPQLVEALRLEQGGPERERMHRIRIAAVLRECPRLARVWFHDGPAHDAEFSMDSRRVVTGGGDNQARVWDIASGDPVTPTLKHGGAVRQVSFSPDDRHVLTASLDGTARVWDANTGREVFAPLKHSAAVTMAVFSNKGNRILTVGGNVVKIWDSSTGKETGQALKPGVSVQHAAFSPDGQRIVTAAGKEAQIWNAATGSRIGRPLPHEGTVFYACFSPDGSRVATASADHMARLWNAASGQEMTKPLAHGQAVTMIQFSFDGKNVVTASDDGTARIWDAEAGTSLPGCLKHKSQITDASFSRDGRHVVTASDDNTARVWSSATGLPVGPFLVQNGMVESARFSRDGHFVLTASSSGIVRLWELNPDTGSFAPTRRAAVPLRSARNLDGTLEIVPGEGLSLLVRNVRSGKLLGPPLTPSSTTLAASFDPEGKRVVLAGANLSARVWDIATGKPLTERMKHASLVACACFSPDGTKVGTASDDNTARVWDAASGLAITPLLKHDGNVYQIVFHPDGRSVLTASNDGTARVWDAATGEPVTPPLDPEGWAKQALRTPTRNEAWDLPQDNRTLDQLNTQAEWLSCHRIDAGGNVVPLALEELQMLWEKVRLDSKGNVTLSH